MTKHTEVYVHCFYSQLSIPYISRTSRTQDWRAPHVAAEAVVAFCPVSTRHNMTIIDVGARTGLLGQEVMIFDATITKKYSNFGGLII